MVDALWAGPVAVPAPTAAGHPVRNDDGRFVPSGGSVGQLLTKTGAGDYAMAWATLAPGPGGWVDCSAMTLVSQVNAASLAAATGSTIWLGRRPVGSELVADETLVLRPYQRIMGAGGRQRLTRIVPSAGFTAGQPIVAAQGWLSSAATCDNPCSIVGVSIDCAGKTGSHGLVVYSFWSHFEDVQVLNADGSAACGILATDKGANGTTVTSNSHSENTFVRCRFDGFTNLARGFRAESNNNASNQDGHLVDSFFSSVTGNNVDIGRAAGWTVDNCHLYSVGAHAIKLDNCYGTKCTRNYVENFGLNDTASAFYNGITMTMLDTRASVMALNTVSTSQPAAPNASQFTCFQVRAGSGQLRANVVVVGNTATWSGSTAPTTNKSQAFRLGESGDTGRMLYVEWAANQIEAGQSWGWMSPARYQQGSTVTLTEPALAGASGVPTTRQILSGTGLTGGGDLSADRTLTVTYGTTAGTAAQGNDSRITGAVQGTRQVLSGTGLTGGGDLTADRTLAVTYGTTAGTAAQGNDSRITGAEQAANKGAASGYASLDSGSKVPTGQIPDLSATYIPLSQKGASNGVAALTGTVLPRSYYQYANTTQDGSIVLAGDLAGTAQLPTVPGLALKAGKLTPTASKTAAYTAVSGDLVMCDASGGGFTVTLPAAAADVLISIKKTDSSTNAVTIARAGSDTIGALAATSVTLGLQDQSLTLLGRAGSWVILHNQLTLATLDSRFAAAARTLTAGTGLTGGGDLSADRSFAVAYGTAAGTAAQGNDARITGAEQTANKGAASGYASLDSGTKVPLAQLPTGTTSSTVCIGNDARLSDARTPTAHTHSTQDITAAIVAVTYSATLTADLTLGRLFRSTMTGNPTVAVPTGGADGDQITWELLASASSRTVTLHASLLLTSGITSSYVVASGKRLFLGLRNVNGVGWFVIAAALQS